jgi:hypothetical protein
MDSILQGLQYVKSTNGGATVENFFEDWEPIGSHLWMRLTEKGLVEIVDGKIFLTELGEKYLKGVEHEAGRCDEGGTPAGAPGE